MADDDQQYGLQAVDHDPFAVDPMAEPAAISLPPDQPKPEASPQTTPAPAGDGWDRWGAVGGAMKLATAVAHPGSFTNLVADKLNNLSMPTREQWQTGEQALGHTAEHLATLPMRIADKLGLLTTPTEPETPGQVSESDVEKEQARAAAEGTFGASTAMQMVLGGPGAAEEGAAAMGMRGKLTQPDAAAEAARVDQRLPTAKKPIESEGPNRVDTDAMRLTPKSYENNVGLVRNYPGVKIPPSASTDAASDAFVDHVKDNLLWLYDQVPDDIKARSSQWYDGGNKIAKDWANKYDVPDSTVAGVIAATSPQKDWYNNVSIAKRILDTTKGDRSFYENQKTTPEMEQFFRDTPSLNKPELQPIFDEIRGKSLADIDRIMPYPEDERDIYKALWIRLHDQAHVDPSYPLITPEGNFGPTVNAKNTEEPTRVAWGSLPEIAKAVNIVNANGDPVALNQMMGFRHKVRNFYNNLISPMSQAGDVTIDTHAVAAGLLRPVTANSLEVYHNFGNSPGEGRPAAKNSRKTGLFGTYPLYADAYREAAAEAGVLPRQLQSVTWEAVRGLFPEDWKSAKNSAIIDNIWRQYRSGKETLDGARQRILNTTGGIQPPSWYRPARANNAPTQGAGNAPELFEPRVYGPGSQPSFTGTGRGTAGGASAPVVRPSPRDLAYEFDFGAGAPYNEQFPGWANLSGDQKATISKAMLDKIADHAKEVTGANEYARLSGLGGWHEFTNPSYKSRLVATPEVAGDFADTMGYLAQQTKIMGYRPDPAGDRLGLALYGDGLGDEKKLAAFWRDVNDKYPDFSSGFSPSRNQRGQPGIEMLFDKNEPGMADRVKSELIPGLQRLADDHAIGKVDSGIFRATEESREHDWQKDPTGGDYTSRLLARHGPDLLKRLELFKRQELEPALQQHIDAAQGTSPGRGGDRGTGIQETQGAPSLPFRAAASPVTLGSGITDKRTAPLRLPIWWHGSASGDLRGGQSGLHLGTKLAATQALESRIGTPADGMGWTGDTEYGKRLLAGTKTLNKMGPYNETGIRAGSRDIDYPEEDHYAGDYFKQNPSEHPKYPDGTKMPLDVKPSVEPYYITGSMNNHPGAPYGDWKANGYMKGALKRGIARNGYYYENQGEDSGSISAVVPNGDHVKAAPGHSIYNDTTLGSGVTDERTAAVRAAAAAAGGRPNLIGLPTDNITLAGKPFVPGPVGALHDIAEKYMSDAGLPYDPPKTWVPVDKGRATKIAQAFEDMKHAPDDPQVKASYDAMANETVAQFKALKDSGIKFEFIKPGMDDPYAENPRAAAKDVIENKHLWVFPTEGGFGSGSEAATAAMKNNPLLRPSGEKIEGKEVPVNDLFRIVHDVFGHLKDGNGFRASGEENAWRSHSAMYSDAARPAMTSETRGQNSWVNYGPHGDFNRTASGADTKYADQKIGLLPKWAVDEGRGDTHNFEPVDHNPFKGTAPILRSDHDVSDLISSRPVLQIDPMKRAGGGTVSSTQPSLDKPSIWQSVRDRAYSAPKDEFNPDNTGIDIIPGAHLPDEQRGGMKARDIRGSASGGPVPPRGGDIGNVQSTVAPLVQALDQAVPDFDPEALGFRPSTNVEDVRNKPDWQREIESMTRAPLGIPAHDWPGAAINTNFGVLRAHGGRVEAKNIDHAPTEAQKKAGNYAKDHVHIHGMPITIENPKGGTRRGIGHDGKPWEVTMPAHYGYIKQTEGADGDHVDVYVGPHQKSPHVYVVDQVQAETKKFDEHKALIGFGSEAQAINTYKRGFSDGKGANRIGTITGMTVAQFRDWLRHGNHGKPFKHTKTRSERVREILARNRITTHGGVKTAISG